MVACEKRVTKVTQLVKRLIQAFAEDIDPVQTSKGLQAPRAPSQDYGLFSQSLAHAVRAQFVTDRSEVQRVSDEPRFDSIRVL